MSKNPNASNPSAFLKNVLGRPVVVKLNSGVDYRGEHLCTPSEAARALTSRLRSGSGVLACLDGFMNIAMEQTEEYVNGQLKAKYGDAFIRGNNGAARPARRDAAPHRAPPCAPHRALTGGPALAAQCSISARKRGGS